MTGAPRGGADRSSDAGVSLVELLVTMVLVSVLGVLLVTVFARGTAAVRTAEGRVADAMVAKVALENVTKGLRTASDPDGADAPAYLAFEVAAPDQVVFFAALGTRSGAGPASDTRPVKVRYALEAVGADRALVEERFLWNTATAAYAGTPATRRVLARSVVDTGQPLFTYLARSDAPDPAAGGATTSTLDVDGLPGVTGGDLGAIGAVELRLSIDSRPGDAAPASTVLDRVTLLNVE